LEDYLWNVKIAIMNKQNGKHVLKVILRGVNRPKFGILKIFAGGQGGRTGPLVGPGQRPGGGSGGEAPGSSWTLREIKAQYAIS